MYADDSTECASGKIMAILEEQLKADTDKIVMWCDENRMATNDQKIKSMLITTYQKFYKLPIKQLHVFIRDYELEFDRVEKLLGESIGQNLTWKSHTDKKFKTVGMALAFMFPHLGCVWGSAQLERLFKLQKRPATMIYDLPTRTPTAPLLKQPNWKPIMDRIKYRKAVMVFKSLNGLAPQYIKDLFQFVGEVSCRSTRNSDKTKFYLAPGSHLKVYRDRFEFSADVA